MEWMRLWAERMRQDAIEKTWSPGLGLFCAYRDASSVQVEQQGPLDGGGTDRSVEIAARAAPGTPTAAVISSTSVPGHEWIKKAPPEEWQECRSWSYEEATREYGRYYKAVSPRAYMAVQTGCYRRDDGRVVVFRRAVDDHGKVHEEGPYLMFYPDGMVEPGVLWGNDVWEAKGERWPGEERTNDLGVVEA